jgi:hypothetical protein
MPSKIHASNAGGSGRRCFTLRLFRDRSFRRDQRRRDGCCKRVIRA